MATSDTSKQQDAMTKAIALLFKLPWLEIIAELWKLIRKFWRGMADEGIYEVITHQATLELLDKQGKKARVYKKQHVRYLQNNIFAFQDQGWGDGEILLNYRCTPGVEVDRYQLDHKTIVLISLRERKQKEDKDEFNIQWDICDGFTQKEEQWTTEVSHRMQHLKIEVIFPKSRPPIQVSLTEYLRQRTQNLSQQAIRQLPTGQWRVSWETDRPRLHERYILKWLW